MSPPWLDAFITATAWLGLDYGFLRDAGERAALLRGLRTTLLLCAATIPGSLLVGIAGALLLSSRRRWLAGATRCAVELTRNTPTLAQLYCAFFVLNSALAQGLRHAGLDLAITPFAWVVIVLSLHKGVFHAEALRAGLQAVPVVTLEAAHSLGLSDRQVTWRIQIPIALRFALPVLTYNLIELIKMTAIGSAIAVGELTYQSILIWTRRDNVLEMILILLLCFTTLSWLASRAGRRLDNALRMPGYGQ